MRLAHFFRPSAKSGNYDESSSSVFPWMFCVGVISWQALVAWIKKGSISAMYQFIVWHSIRKRIVKQEKISNSSLWSSCTLLFLDWCFTMTTVTFPLGASVTTNWTLELSNQTDLFLIFWPVVERLDNPEIDLRQFVSKPDIVSTQISLYPNRGIVNNRTLSFLTTALLKSTPELLEPYLVPCFNFHRHGCRTPV